MSEDSIALSVMIEAAAGQEDELGALLGALVAPTRSEGGFLGYVLHASADKPGVFLFYETFRDQAALDAHVASQHFQSFLKQREQSDPIAHQTVERWSIL